MFDVWSKDIDDSIRLVNNHEDSATWFKSAMTQIDKHINGKYQFLQKIRTYFRTHHNGKPLTIDQKDCLLKMISYLESCLGYSCSSLKKVS